MPNTPTAPRAVVEMLLHSGTEGVTREREKPQRENASSGGRKNLEERSCAGQKLALSRLIYGVYISGEHEGERANRARAFIIRKGERVAPLEFAQARLLMPRAPRRKGDALGILRT